jgi:hypothetical protein
MASRSEKWFVNGLKWGAILGGALFAVAALTMGGPIGVLLVNAAFAGIVGGLAGGAVLGILGGIAGLIFQIGDKASGVLRDDQPQPQQAVSSPQPAMQPQPVQAQGQAAGPSSTYFQNQVAASRANGTVQR